MNPPLHIAHAVLSLDVGGLERMVLNLTKTARESGHRVSVVCVERDGQLATEARELGATVVSLDKPAGRHPWAVEKAGEQVRSLNPDVVHTHQMGAAWYVAQAAQKLGVPVLHTEHGNQFARNRSWVETVKSRYFFHQTARFVNRYCCVSREVANAVTRWRTVPSTKVEVVPNGIALHEASNEDHRATIRNKLDIPRDALVVGSVGRLAEVKRQDLLVRAVARLRDEFPTLHLLLVGEGPERAALEKLAGELGLPGQIRLAGYQTQPEPYLQAMDVFALSSRSEGFPVSLLEAWAAGVPAVCPAVGGIPEIAQNGETVLLFPGEDESALTQTLRKMLADSELRAFLARNGRKTVQEKYALDRVAEGYERRYRELLNERGGRR